MSASVAPVFDDLQRRIAAEQDPVRRVEVLVSGLADAIKGASNDQNIQRLARELRQASHGLAEATAGR